MSSKKETVTPHVEITASKPEERQKIYLSNLIDNININNLGSSFYKEDSLFKKRLEKLNFKFYTETEKYLNNKQDMESSQDQLFVILFKQISLYMEENERLNKLLKEKEENDKLNNKDDIHKKEREKLATQQTINYLKASAMNLEKKMSEKIKSEEKMKQEIESLKRQLKFYKDKLQLEVNVKKTIQAAKKIVKATNLNTINYEENQKKDEKQAFNSNKITKNPNSNLENGKINNLEISVNKYREDGERLSESSKKGRKSVLSEEIDECMLSGGNEEREKTKSNIPAKYVQSHSPNRLLNINIQSAINAKKNITTTHTLRLNTKKEGKEVKLSTSVQNKLKDQNKEKNGNNDNTYKVEQNELKEFANNLTENVDAELEELNELENQLLRIKGGLDNSKIELKIDSHQSIDLDASPTNKRQKLSTKNAGKPAQSVTIDLNSTKTTSKVK